MHNDVTQVDQYPFGFLLAFYTEREYPGILGEFHHFVGDGFNMSGGGSRSDDQQIGNGGFTPHIDNAYIASLEFFESGKYVVTQVLSRRGRDGLEGLRQWVLPLERELRSTSISSAV